MREARGTGHGKVILLGEHAVVHGRPAIAAALDRGVTVTVTDLPRSPELDERATEAFHQMADEAGVGRLHARSESDLPMGAGLGSSAAFSVAAARALLLWSGQHHPTAQDVLWLAGIGESVFHGNPSGVDAAIAARGGVIRFRRGAPPDVTSLPAPQGIPLVVADTGDRASTKDQVAAVTALYQENWKSKLAIGALLDVLEALAGTAEGFLASGSWAKLGKSFDAAQSILVRLGVGTPRLNDGCQLARAAGALGAKLTGGGGGGCLIALAPVDPTPVVAALEAAGYAAFSASLAPSSPEP
jgi:mevalonate kinase